MTAQEIIESSLRSLGVIASGETPSAEELADGLEALNNLIDSWSAQALPIPEVTRETVVMNGAASYTLGTRPIKITGAQLSNDNVLTKFEIVTSEQWSDHNLVNVIYWDGATSSKVYLRPSPSAGNLVLDELRPLGTLATLATSFTIAGKGYERGLRFNLALDLAGEYGKVPDEALIGLANDSKIAIQGLNQNVLGAPVPAEA